MATKEATEDSRKRGDGDDVKEEVRNLLREQKIKLWLEPYVTEQIGSRDALEALVHQWISDQLFPADTSQDEILKALQQWQEHAMEKWRSKQQHKGGQAQQKIGTTSDKFSQGLLNLEIKILGLGEQPNINEDDWIKTGLAQTVNMKANEKNQIVMLRLQGVAANRTDSELIAALQQLCQTDNMRLIYRGRTMAANEGMPKALGRIIQTGTNNKEKPAALLCLLSHNQNDGKLQERTTSKGSDPTDIRSRIAAIRRAAGQIQDTSNIEITDQRGCFVKMTKNDRLGFLTALALHGMGTKSVFPKEDRLIMLLEADDEWNRYPSLLETWRYKVDNYGFLQLDIAWQYLQLESLENLPDSLRRLEEAERVLKKQVHVNFVPLALAQAEAGNAGEVPPLAAVFAKLFLLQGIAYSYDASSCTSRQKSKDCLDQAYSLLQCLRSMTPEDSIQSLLEVMTPTLGYASLADDSMFSSSIRADAIAALRKAQGDLNAAAATMSEEIAQRSQSRRERQAQQQYGFCANEIELVDLAQIESLQAMLPSDQVAGGSYVTNGNDRTTCKEKHSELATGLMRLANNSVDKALDIYRDNAYDPIQIRTMVDSLDQRLVERGLMSRKTFERKQQTKKRKFQAKPAIVDEVALATLLSVGVEDRERASKALQESGNNVEQALLWLSKNEESIDTAAAAAGAVSEDQKAGENGEQPPPGAHDVASLPQQQEKESSDGSKQVEEVNDAPPPDQTPDELAMDLLRNELAGVLGGRDLEKEYFGSSLDEEWKLVQQYRKPSE